MKHILELFERSNYGIRFLNPGKGLIQSLKKVVIQNDFERTMNFINILNTLARSKKYKLLSSEGYLKVFNKESYKNLDKTYEYIFKNFNKPINLNDVANIANMNPSAFSRYFKRINRKTFIKYLNDIRIGYACKLLIENKYNIIQVCYESGFNNISNFNRQFRTIKKMSPSEFIKRYEILKNN